MNTKEAIKYLDDLQDENFELQEEYNNKRILEVIALLKRGEKFEAMWQTLLEDLDFMPNKEKLHMNWEDTNDLMIKIRQRYFPVKEKNGNNRNTIKKNTT